MEIEENNELSNNGLYMRINTELKKQFNIECIKRNTTMTDAIMNFIKEYIQEAS